MGLGHAGCLYSSARNEYYLFGACIYAYPALVIIPAFSLEVSLRAGFETLL